MDTATLFAFAATFPTIFEGFMEDVAEHVELETVNYELAQRGADDLLRDVTTWDGSHIA